jgi:hypothetical protein
MQRIRRDLEQSMLSLTFPSSRIFEDTALRVGRIATISG